MPDNTMVGGTAPLSGDDRLSAALAKLDASRLALRQELIMAPDAEPGSAGAGTGGLADPLRRWWRRLRRASQRSPLAALATDALQGWWQRHPWRPAASLVLGQVRPVVQQHPLACASAAAVLGAVLVGSKPWRWRAVDGHLRPLPGRVGHWLLAELGRAPVQAALASLALTALRATASAPAAASDTAAGPAADLRPASGEQASGPA